MNGGVSWRGPGGSRVRPAAPSWQAHLGAAASTHSSHLISSSLHRCKLFSFFFSPSSLSRLVPCRVADTWGCRATGCFAVISLIASEIISPLPPKESAVGQWTKTGIRLRSRCVVWESCLAHKECAFPECFAFRDGYTDGRRYYV